VRVLRTRTLFPVSFRELRKYFLICKEKQMRIDRSLGNILLAVYLILAGLAAFGVGAQILSIIMGICALLAGIIFLINR
jgi:hypothetical protein